MHVILDTFLICSAISTTHLSAWVGVMLKSIFGFWHFCIIAVIAQEFYQVSDRCNFAVGGASEELFR